LPQITLSQSVLVEQATQTGLILFLRQLPQQVVVVDLPLKLTQLLPEVVVAELVLLELVQQEQELLIKVELVAQVLITELEMPLAVAVVLILLVVMVAITLLVMVGLEFLALLLGQQSQELVVVVEQPITTAQIPLAELVELVAVVEATFKEAEMSWKTPLLEQ
jgi:hypothetical protein